jgi:xylulokinase
VVPQFGLQGKILASVAEELGLNKTVQITYRAGDQPNNAFSLQVLNPGEVAATAGTSGVVYGVTDQVKYDPLSRVNTFLHVNHEPLHPRLGVLLCINGTGILNSWLKKNIAAGCSYEEMNALALSVNAGSDGLVVLPFGNGAERILKNKSSDCQIHGLNFNHHSQAHLIRAAHEGIAFAFKYGMDIMKESGISLNIIRAGYANMFLSPVFRQTLSTITGTEIQLFNTDGALGAARAAAVGAGIYQSYSQAFENFKQLETITPNPLDKAVLEQAYFKWKSILINKTK